MPNDNGLPFDADNPELTDGDFARMQPPSELPAHVLAAFPRTVKRAGRPRVSTKEQVAIRLDQDILSHFRAGGPGWQTRINETLRKAIG